MLPVIYKLEFGSPAMQVVLWLAVLGLTLYGAWSGWRGAGEEASVRLKRLRALTFGAFSGVVSLIAAVYGAPPFTPGTAQAVTYGVYALCAVMVVGAFLYGQQDGKEREGAKKGDELNTAGTYAVFAVVISYAAVKYGLAAPLGKGFGAPLHTYGLMIATAFIVSITVAAREAERAYPGWYTVNGKVQLDDQKRPVPLGVVMRDHLLDLGFYILISSLVGSRVLFIIVNWKDYAPYVQRGDFAPLFGVTGGLVFYGGFIGAALASLWYCKANKLDFLRIADVAIPSVSLGHMFGRLGCLGAGCCWGDIAKEGSPIAIRFPAARNLPFGGFGTDSLAFQDQARDHRWADALGHLHKEAVEGGQQISAYAKAHGFSMPVYPTQLMESGGELVLFLILISLRKHKRFHGQILAMWLMGYAVLRTTVEFFRGDLARGYLFRWPEVDPLLLSTSQSISLGIFAAGVAVFALYGRKGKGPAAPVPA